MSRRMNLSSFFLLSLGYVLLLEWIWPIERLSGTAEIWIFIVFLSVSYLLALLNVPLWISGLTKGLVILYLLHQIYFEGSFFQIKWFSTFMVQLFNNMYLLFSRQWGDISHIFRSFLFFILLSLMVYLLNYWLTYRKKILIIYLLTLIYITVLDTFTEYDAKYAIVRMVFIGFIMLGILTYQRLLSKENMEPDKRLSKNWILSFSVFLLVSTILGYGLPKANPIWPDPLSYLGLSDKLQAQTGQTKRVGYGIDDTSLGGPMVGDSTVVFKTAVDSSHYWKVETKDVYTGKGWVQSDMEPEPIPFKQNTDVPISTFEEEGTVEKTEQISKVTQVMKYAHVLYPLGVKNIQAENNNFSFQLDPSIEKIYSFNGSESAELSSYTITFDKPSYNLDALQTIDDTYADDVSNDFMSRYTQLPEVLPKRVRNLAVELTRDSQGWYDKAKAIETYLKGPDFSYDLSKAAIPGEKEDYVDQFLFDSKVGYCNNFSTSMVVMLRSLHIPARWVKGYTEGEYIQYQDGKYLYDVTNNNAHAWVEVFFPHIGWVPFEPTPGFSNVISYYTDEAEAENIASIQHDQQQKQNKVEDSKNQDSLNENNPITTGFVMEKIKEVFSNNKGWVAVIFLFLIGMVLYLYRIRVKWLPFFYIRKFRFLEEDEYFLHAYLILLKQLNRYGIKRKEGQTLREYAQVIDRCFSTEEMTFLTLQYEQYIYGNHLINGVWKDSKQLWENLIKRTIA